MCMSPGAEKGHQCGQTSRKLHSMLTRHWIRNLDDCPETGPDEVVTWSKRHVSYSLDHAVGRKMDIHDDKT